MDGLLLVAHGSRLASSDDEMQQLCTMTADAMPGVEVAMGYLEMSLPAAGSALDALVERGCRRVVVQPLMLLGAGHAKSDVPAVVLEGRARHPSVELLLGGPLGVSKVAVDLCGEAVSAAGGKGLPLLVVARGTSDPDANGDAFKAARLIAEWTGAPFFQVGFSGVTGPSVSEAARTLRRLGHDRFAVVWWFLGHGRLIDRGRAELEASVAGSSATLVDAGHIGPDPRLVPLVVGRFREALDGRSNVNCDTCAYRAPWPGREDRVGQPVGVGHSHLASEHRAGAHAH